MSKELDKMPLMRGHRSGGKTTDGRFKTTRSYVAPSGFPVKKEFVQRKDESQKSVHKRADEWLSTERGKLPSPSMPLTSAFERFIEHCENKNLSKNTIRGYKVAIKNINTSLGQVKLSALSSWQVNELCTIHGKETKTAKDIRDVGRNAYNYFLACKWATENPFELATPISYRVSDSEERILTSEEAQEIIDEVEPQFRTFFVLLRWTGCRPILARNLLRSELEVDSDGDMWINSKTVNRDSKKWKGLGKILVPEVAAEAIRQLPITSLYLFPNAKTGKPMHESTYTHAWQEAQQRINERRIEKGMEPYKQCGPYSLKHLRVSELVNTGADIKIVMKLVGLKSEATLRKHYQQVGDEQLKGAVGMSKSMTRDKK